MPLPKNVAGKQAMIKSILALLDPMKPPPLPMIAYQQKDGPRLTPIDDFGKASVSPIPRCSIVLDNEPRKARKPVKPVAKSRKTKKGKKKKKKVGRSQKRREASKLDDNIKIHLKLSNESQLRQPKHETRALELRNFDFEQDSKFAQDARRRLYTPKSKRKQELYEQMFINWRPVDDFMLLSSMINVNDLDVGRRCAGFTRPFLPEEIKMRWDMFLIDDITRKHMMSRFNMLSADHKSLIWTDLPFSLAEMEVLSAVSPYARPTRQDFNVLKTSFPEVFPRYRAVAAIEVQWKWMLAVGMLEHCFKNERMKTVRSTITFLKPKSTKANDEAATCKTKEGVLFPENDFSYNGFEDYEIPPIFQSNVPVIKPDSSDIRAKLYGLKPESTSTSESVSHGVTRMEIDVAKQITVEDMAVPSQNGEEIMDPVLPFSINALQLLGKLNLPPCHFQGFSKKYPVTEFRFFIGRSYPWARPNVDLYDEAESLKIAPKQALVEFCRFTGEFKIRNHGKYEIRVNKHQLPQGGICPLPIGSILEFHRCVLFFNPGNASDEPPSKYPYANEDYFNDRVWKEKLVIVPRGKVLPMYCQPETSTEETMEADPETTFEIDVKSVVDDLINNVVALERVGSVRHGGPTAPPHHETRWNIERVRTNFSRRLGVSERPKLNLLPMMHVVEKPVEPEPIQAAPPSPPKPVPTLPPIPVSPIAPSPEPSSSVVENNQQEAETSVKPVTKPAKTRKTKEPKEKKPRKVREKKIKPPKPPKEPKPPRIRKPRPPKAATYQAPGQYVYAPTMFTGQGSHAPMFTGQGGRPLEAPFISTAAPVTFHTLSTSSTMLNQPRQPTVLRRIIAPPPTSSIPPGFVPLSTYTVSQIPRPTASLILPPRQPTPVQRQPEPMVIMPRGQTRPMPSPVVFTSASRIPAPRIQRPMPVIVTTSAPMPSTPMTTHTVRTITVPRPVRNPNPTTHSIPVIQGQPRPTIRLIRPPNPSGFAPPRGPSNVVFLKPTQRLRTAAPASSGPRPAAPANASKLGPSSVASTSKSGPSKPATQKPGPKQGPASKTKAKSPTKPVQRKPPARPGAAKASKPPPPPKVAAASTKPPTASKATATAPNQPPLASEPATAEPPQKRRPGRPRKYPVGEEPHAKRPKK